MMFQLENLACKGLTFHITTDLRVLSIMSMAVNLCMWLNGPVELRLFHSPDLCRLGLLAAKHGPLKQSKLSSFELNPRGGAKLRICMSLYQINSPESGLYYIWQNGLHDVHRPASAALSQSPPLACCPLAGLQWSASQLLPYLGHPHRCVTVQCSWPLGLLSGGLVLQPVLLPGLVVIAGWKWSWCWWLRETPYFLNSYCHNWVQVRYTPHCA